MHHRGKATPICGPSAVVLAIVLLQLLLVYPPSLSATPHRRSVVVQPGGGSISSAITALSGAGGGEVIVMGGTYNNEEKVVSNVGALTLTINASATITGANGSDIWLSINNGGSLLIQGASLTLRGCGLQLQMSSSLQQSANLVITAPPGIGVDVQQNATWVQDVSCSTHISSPSGDQSKTLVAIYVNATWTQSGTVQLETSGYTAVDLQGAWEQTNIATMSLNNAAGVVLSPTGKWTQSKEAEISGMNAHAVQFKQGGTWNQNNKATIKLDSSSTGVQMTGGVWQQNDLVEISNAASGNGVVLQGGVWEQTAEARLSSFYNSLGVSVEAGGTWQQSARFQANVTNGSSGVAVRSGTWTSTSTTAITARDAVAGVALWSGTFDQSGTLEVNLTNSIAGGAATAGVWSYRTAQSSIVWKQKSAATIRATNATGVLLCALMQWQQLAPTKLVLNGTAVGVNMSAGGSWYQRGNMTVNVLSSPSSVVTGFICGSSQACCAQAQDTNAVSFTTLSQVATRDDCSAANPSPSSTPAPTLALINSTATFSNSTAAVSVTGSTTSSSPSSPSAPGGTNQTQEVGVTLSLASVSVGNSSSTPTTFSVRKLSSDNDTNINNGSTAYLYETHLNPATSLAQTFGFYSQPQALKFAGTQFTVNAGALKWSLNLTGGGSDGKGFTVEYELGTLLSATAAGQPLALSGEVLRKADTPQRGMTTYVVRLSSDSSVVVAVEVFDVALVDGLYASLNHSLERLVSNATSGANATAVSSSFRLLLQFPAYTKSLEYDPSIGLGVLLTGSSSSGGGGSDDNTALIVATAVAIPLAVLFVVAAIVLGSLVFWRRKRKWQSDLGQVMLERQDEESQSEL